MNSLNQVTAYDSVNLLARKPGRSNMKHYSTPDFQNMVASTRPLVVASGVHTAESRDVG